MHPPNICNRKKTGTDKEQEMKEKRAAQNPKKMWISLK